MSERSPVPFPGADIQRLAIEEWCRRLADDIAGEEWPERAYSRELVLRALREAAATVGRQRRPCHVEACDVDATRDTPLCIDHWLALPEHLRHDFIDLMRTIVREVDDYEEAP